MIVCVGISAFEGDDIIMIDCMNAGCVFGGDGDDIIDIGMLDGHLIRVENYKLCYLSVQYIDAGDGNDIVAIDEVGDTCKTRITLDGGAGIDVLCLNNVLPTLNWESEFGRYDTIKNLEYVAFSDGTLLTFSNKYIY